MSFFNVRIIGLEELAKEFREEVKNIEKQIPTALNTIGAEMIENLQEHIQRDFYDRYTPGGYIRRAKDPSKGTAMIDDSHMNYFTHGKTLDFIYLPATAHADYHWWIENRPNKGVHPLPRTPNDLIIWGQHSQDDGQIPARPFWNQFVEDQANEKIMLNFTRGMLPYNVITEKDAPNVVLDGDEMLPADEAQIQADFGSFNEDDEELPY